MHCYELYNSMDSFTENTNTQNSKLDQLKELLEGINHLSDLFNRSVKNFNDNIEMKEILELKEIKDELKETINGLIDSKEEVEAILDYNAPIIKNDYLKKFYYAIKEIHCSIGDSKEEFQHIETPKDLQEIFKELEAPTTPFSVCEQNDYPDILFLLVVTKASITNASNYPIFEEFLEKKKLMGLFLSLKKEKQNIHDCPVDELYCPQCIILETSIFLPIPKNILDSRHVDDEIFDLIKKWLQFISLIKGASSKNAIPRSSFKKVESLSERIKKNIPAATQVSPQVLVEPVYSNDSESSESSDSENENEILSINQIRKLIDDIFNKETGVLGHHYENGCWVTYRSKPGETTEIRVYIVGQNGDVFIGTESGYCNFEGKCTNANCTFFHEGQQILPSKVLKTRDIFDKFIEKLFDEEPITRKEVNEFCKATVVLNRLGNVYNKKDNEINKCYEI